jgi:2,5-diamino-6-(ribosylamino)-4(3H)-pyrimidinone 5'-phosphate reductase
MPDTTLFMLASLDGKISTGASDARDFDRDLPCLPGLSAGLEEYYALERSTAEYSLNSGRVMAKVGWNDTVEPIAKLPVTFVLVDSAPHLAETGVRNLLLHARGVIVVTSNPRHPALGIDDSRLEVVLHEGAVDLRGLFAHLDALGVRELTVQSGGELNASLLRLGLIDHVSVVVAPILVGGRSTPGLVGGEPAVTEHDLGGIVGLQFSGVEMLSASFLYVLYDVVPRTTEPAHPEG